MRDSVLFVACVCMFTLVCLAFLTSKIGGLIYAIASYY